MGDSIAVEKIEGESGGTVDFNEVLLVAESPGEVMVGTPRVEGAKVTAEIAAQVKDKKKIHFRYKNKTRSGIKRGHRQRLTEIVIKSIETE